MVWQVFFALFGCARTKDESKRNILRSTHKLRYPIAVRVWFFVSMHVNSIEFRNDAKKIKKRTTEEEESKSVANKRRALAKFHVTHCYFDFIKQTERTPPSRANSQAHSSAYWLEAEKPASERKVCVVRWRCWRQLCDFLRRTRNTSDIRHWSGHTEKLRKMRIVFALKRNAQTSRDRKWTSFRYTQ